ncbi:MAG: endonuclease [Pseudomonadota bacterium]
MRKVDRSAVTLPVSVTGPEGSAARELDRIIEKRAEGTQKSSDFRVYKSAAIKAALETLFHGKCAYCESYYRAQAPVDVEHFRPKGKVEDDDDHPGYWWLGMEWENLLPSCIDCNRKRKQQTPKQITSLAALHTSASEVMNTGKKDTFPVLGTRAVDANSNLLAERPVLLDPTTDTPTDHIRYHVDRGRLISLVLPVGDTDAVPVLGDAGQVQQAAEDANLSVRGAVSIQVYGLNRLGLVQKRTGILRHLEFLRHVIEEMDVVAAQLANHADPAVQTASGRLDVLIDLIIEEIAKMAAPEAEYSSLVVAWVDQYLDDLRS